MIAIVAATPAYAEPDHLARTWEAIPQAEASSGARVELGVGQLDQHQAEGEAAMPVSIMAVARVSLRVVSGLQLDATMSAELPTDSIVLASPSLAATWSARFRELRVAVRGVASTAIAGSASPMLSSASASLLAHDPLLAWSDAHTGTLQGSVSGRAGQLRWAIAGAVTELVPIDFPRHQTLVRVDAALAGWASSSWSWALELGAISDVLDEEFDEGTDLVPLWSAGFHHHRAGLAMGVKTTGGWFGGSRHTVLGPSVLLSVEGPL